MSRRRVHSTGRLLTAILLAAYAPLGVLGYGLHRVLHVEHAGCSQPAAAACHCHSGHQHHAAEATPSFGDESCRDCSICAFLAQAQSASIAIVAPERVAPLATTAPLSEHLVVFHRLESALARGPPARS